MTQPNTLSPTDTQNEKTIEALKYEIESLKFRLKKKDDLIASLEIMLNQIMEGNTAAVRACDDLEDKLEDVIEMIRKRIPHGDILEYLKVEDKNQL